MVTQEELTKMRSRLTQIQCCLLYFLSNNRLKLFLSSACFSSAVPGKPVCWEFIPLGKACPLCNSGSFQGAGTLFSFRLKLYTCIPVITCLALVWEADDIWSPQEAEFREATCSREPSPKRNPKDSRAAQAPSRHHSFQPWTKKFCPSLSKAPSGWEVSVSAEKLPHCVTCCACARKAFPVSVASTSGLLSSLSAVCSGPPSMLCPPRLWSVQPQLQLGWLRLADPPAWTTGHFHQSLFGLSKHPLFDTFPHIGPIKGGIWHSGTTSPKHFHSCPIQ